MMMRTVFLSLLLFRLSVAFTDDLIEMSMSNLIALSGQLGRSTLTTSLVPSKGKPIQSRANVPQSLTLLMNFKNDGTTQFQIMQGSQVLYVNVGSCKYGQLFDPATGRCRDIFCQEVNYKFNGSACIPDGSKNATMDNVYKRMSDIDLSLTMDIVPTNPDERGNFSKRLHSRMNDTCTGDWARMIHTALQSYLLIDYGRITKVSYELKPNETHAKNKSTTSTSTVKPFEKPNGVANIGTRDLINTAIAMDGLATIDFRFTMTDRNETSDDKLTGLHVITLLLPAIEAHLQIDLCERYSMKIQKISIESDTNKTQVEFCSPPDVSVMNGNGNMHLRMLPDGEFDYVLHVPSTDTTYEGGDFTYTLMVSSMTPEQQRIQQLLRAGAPYTSSNGTSQSRMVAVCNRQPRIAHRCPDSLVMRIALCEVTQYQNFSIRVKRTGQLYTNRDYRFDEYRSDMYVVVCKHDFKNVTTSGRKLGFMEKAPGFLSTIATILSIFALAITLLTFALFSSLRNLPGCNTINLIIALIIAQILFLSQSLIMMTRSSVCLMFALGIHFFYLASFFWMNVMAFDLWRTFHKGFSLYIYDIRERLPFYMIYAWGMPVLIVLIGIILDAGNAKMKPCYGRFFRGCYDVCFRTKDDTPLQGCWIESATMRFVLFGCPVAIILLINFVFYAQTVRSIRKGLKKVRVQVERKFQRKKQVVPGEHDVKIYMRMAVLAGFGWTIGFILFVLPDGQHGFKRYLVATFKYLFILLNATPGLFIFAVYVCNRRVLALYRQLLTRIYQFVQLQLMQANGFLLSHCHVCLNHAKEKFVKYKHKPTRENPSSGQPLESSEPTSPTFLQSLESNTTVDTNSLSMDEQRHETLESD